MRVLQVIHQYRPAIGGSERHTTDLAETLVRRGHTVHVFTTQARDFQTWRNELPAFEILDGVKIYRFPSLQRRSYTWRILDFGYTNYRRTRARRYEPFIFWGNGPLSLSLALNLLLRVQQYDLVHLNTLPYSHVYYGYRIARARRVPIVFTPHVHVEQPETFEVGYFDTVLRGSDRVIADTRIERDYLIGKGVQPDRIVVAGIGIKLAELQRRDAQACRRRLGLPVEGTVLLFLGRKVGYKGLDTVVQAFAALKPRYPSLMLVAAGPETDESIRLQHIYAHLPGFVNLGAVSNDEKLDLLNACDMLVLPSRAEAFGIVFLEAWAVGKPVIGARNGAMPAVIGDGEDGFLVEFGDAAGLAEKIELFLHDPALGARMGIQGYRKVVNCYTVERIADIVEETYRSITQQ